MEIKAMASLRELEQVKGDAALRLEAVRVDHDKRLAALEDVLKWVGRIIAGSVLIALIGLVLKSGLKP